jgi:hypothetical protein
VHTRKGKRLLTSVPEGDCKEGIMLFLKELDAKIDLSDLTFKYPSYYERAFLGRHHKVYNAAP